MFKDRRSRKVALLAHCLINQNAKVAELASYPAVVPGVVALLEKYNFGIQQLPCPELYAAGLRRWWQVSDQYNCTGYRRSCNRLADFVLDQVGDYLDHGFTVVLVGVDGSPSCGVNITDQDKYGAWLGCPSISIQNESDIFKKGMGVFVECLKKRGRIRELPDIPSFGLPLDVTGAQLDLTGLAEFLAQF